MKENLVLKILCSLPIVLILLYFIPFLGICLLLFRVYIYKGNSFKTYYLILIFGLLIFLPKLVYSVFNILNINNLDLPYLNNLINSVNYDKLLNYSRLLIIISIVFIIISYIFRKAACKVNNGLRKYIENDLENDYNIKKENDYKIKIKQEKAKNTHYVKCPYCGSDNIVSGKFDTCQYCRRKIENKHFK